MILPAVAGVLLIVGVLWEAFETVVLPRRVTRRFRFTVLFYRSTGDRGGLSRLCRSRKSNSAKHSSVIFGPLSLLFLFVVYAAVFCSWVSGCSTSRSRGTERMAVLDGVY